MKMPAFTAEASLYNRREHYPVIRRGRHSEYNAVQPAQTEISFIDPNCGPCTCRIFDSGIMRFFFCVRECSRLEFVTPLGEGVYFNYTRSCSPPWRW
jgi:hypothetical protein